MKAHFSILVFALLALSAVATGTRHDKNAVRQVATSTVIICQSVASFNAAAWSDSMSVNGDTLIVYPQT